MLATSLPIVPFYILPRKKWQTDQERKERVDFEIEDDDDDDDDDDEEESFIAAHTDRNAALVGAAKQDERTLGSTTGTVQTGEFFGSSAASVSILGTKPNQPAFGDDSEYDPLEANAQSDEYLAGIADLVKVNPLIAEMYDNGPPEKLSILRIGPFAYAYRHFIRWKENVRKNRMHYMIRNYYVKALKEAEDTRIKHLKDLAQKEHDMLIESYRSEKRIKAAKYKESRKYSAASWLTAAIEQKDKDTARMEYNCYNFQIWAVENHDRKVREAEEVQERIEADERERVALAKQEEFDRFRAVDAAVLQDDLALTQEVIETMRKTGVLPGINVEAKGNVMKVNSNNTKRYVELRIIDNIDMSKSGPRKMRHKDYVSPFTTDLAECRQVAVLRCFDIGEFGAIALGAEVIRGACGHLTHLDLSMCGVKTRGLGRLLYGLRVGGLVTLHTLKLKHNQLTSKVLQMLQECFKAGTLAELRVLDLGFNELGDEGARALSHMMCEKSMYLAQMEQINLQENGITDVGFSKLVKIVVNVKEKHIPHLDYLCLRNNPISGQIRAQYSPIPSYISI